MQSDVLISLWSQEFQIDLLETISSKKNSNWLTLVYIDGKNYVKK